MLLLEHDGKELLAAQGIAVAAGVLVSSLSGLDASLLPPGPWVVKVQVPTGGRGKAGGIRMADTVTEVETQLQALLGSTVKGHPVRGCRVEQRVIDGTEAYVSLSVDAQSGGVQLLMSAAGGVEIEALANQAGAILSAVAAPDLASLQAAGRALVAKLPQVQQRPMSEAVERLAAAFIHTEALLVEVNPLFLQPDGSWLAGDAKVILDDNAFQRQPALVAMAHARKEAYPETEFKLTEDFDYIDLDTDGEVGMVTTGAGLSMMLVDELAERGLRAFNFVDMRTGQMKGDPHRLVLVLERMREGPNIKVLLINVFAGITHLGEFSRLLVRALDQVPALKNIPIVARLLGNGLEEAHQVLLDAKSPVYLETDLEEALARVAELVKKGRR